MGRRAGSAVEFALSLPLFLAITAATVEYGNVYLRQMEMVGIVREAAREGTLRVQTETPGPVEVAEQSISDTLVRNGYTGPFTVTATVSGTAPDQVLDVHCSRPYEPLVGIVPVPPTTSARVVMRLYDQR